MKTVVFRLAIDRLDAGQIVNYSAGQSYELADDQADRFVAAGYADLVPAETMALTGGAPERAQRRKAAG